LYFKSLTSAVSNLCVIIIIALNVEYTTTGSFRYLLLLKYNRIVVLGIRIGRFIMGTGEHPALLLSVAEPFQTFLPLYRT
jgi:hypothetical protein